MGNKRQLQSFDDSNITDEKCLFLPSKFVVKGKKQKISENQREKEIRCKFYDLLFIKKINLLNLDS